MYRKIYPASGNRRDNIKNKISTPTLQKFNAILCCYEDGKIARTEAADKLINGIPSKDDKKFKKGLKEYEKVVTKYENAKPIGSRIIVRQAARKATKVRTQQAISLRLKEKDWPGRPSAGIKSNNQNSKGETTDKRKDLCHSICAFLSVRR